MRLVLVAVGKGMPDWVAAGFAAYRRRLPRQCALELREVASTRHPEDPQRGLREECEHLLSATPKNSQVIALDERGESWSSEALARHLSGWLGGGRPIAFLIGGAAGLDPECKTRADRVWSLSALTLPHMLVRVIVAEQLYRAWSILERHPYHRGEPRGGNRP